MGVASDGTVTKSLTEVDKQPLEEAKVKAKENYGCIRRNCTFLDGMINGGHLGGTVPLTKSDVKTMHPSS